MPVRVNVIECILTVCAHIKMTTTTQIVHFNVAVRKQRQDLWTRPV